MVQVLPSLKKDNVSLTRNLFCLTKKSKVTNRVGFGEKKDLNVDSRLYDHSVPRCNEGYFI